jgi:hypothetical protein
MNTEKHRRNSSFTNAGAFGFTPDKDGTSNTRNLQQAVDQGGTVTVTEPGVYSLADTVYIGSNTSLIFGNGVILKKTDDQGPFTHLFLNKGALTKTYDEHISIEGLTLHVNGVDRAFDQVYGLRGQVAFLYVKDLLIRRFRCPDLEKLQFCIHVCTFEDIIIEDCIIKGKKDGIHLGRGKRFTIRDCRFQTFDDAVALNAHDYATANPELGWIEDGIIENCHDHDHPDKIGFFCRILAGAWIDWKEGMEVQHSDTVVSGGKLYRVQAEPDGTVFTSRTPPSHGEGSQVYDGINWGMAQKDITYTAGVRNVVFRDIILEKPRTAFSVHFDNDRFSRSYYPGAAVPVQENLRFENITIKYDEQVPLFHITTPVDTVSITSSRIGNNGIHFFTNGAMEDYGETRILIYGCTFVHSGSFTLVKNEVAGKKVFLRTALSTENSRDFRAGIDRGKGQVTAVSDLSGLG